MTLTKRQHDVLEFVKRFRQNRGLAPTLEEIATELHVSKVTIFEHLQALERKGYIRKTRNHSRSLEIVDPRDGSNVVPILGRVAAGVPIEPIEVPEEFRLSDLVPSNGCYLLKVEGNSMIDEQIRDGDYVLVERRETAENGETIVAVVHGEGATLKKFYRERDHVRLQAANAEVAPIRARDVKIQGIVRGVIRRY